MYNQCLMNNSFMYNDIIYFMYNEEHQPFWPGWTAKRELLDRYDSKEFTN